MANIIYNSLLEDLANNNVDFGADTFKIMLVGSTYHGIAAETKRDNHDRRDDITDEVSGTGYTAGGATLSNVAVTKDTSNNIIKVTADPVSWTSSTLTGVYGAVIYKSRGGAASADELVCFLDLYAANSNAALSTSNGTLQITFHANGFVSIEPKSGS
jgi:hypothetical protein